MAGFNPQLDEAERMVSFKIGAKDDIPVKEQREIIDFCAVLTNVLGGYVRTAVTQKNERATTFPDKSGLGLDRP